MASRAHPQPAQWVKVSPEDEARLQHLLQAPVNVNIEIEKGSVRVKAEERGAAASDAEEKTWLLCFLNASLSGVDAAASFLFEAGTEKAERAALTLCSFAMGAYKVSASLPEGAPPAALSIALDTTSRRFLQAERNPTQLKLGYFGSPGCSKALELVGLTPQALIDNPRLLVEVHLADLEKAAVLVLPYDSAVLLGNEHSGSSGSGSGSASASASASGNCEMQWVKHPAPEGGSKYVSSDGHCHCCQVAAGVKLKNCAGCSVARYCSPACQRQDWREHKPLCGQLAQWKAEMQQHYKAAVQQLPNARPL